VRIDWDSNAGYRRIRKQARTNQKASKRRDTARRLTRAREPGAFNAPAAFSPNPSVTGSVIENKNPSNRSFCSLAHQTSQSMVGSSKVVEMSHQDLPPETSKVSTLLSKVLSNI